MSISRRWLTISLLLTALVAIASASDLRISLPKRSKLTPVQKLNQEGVKDLQKHNYKKAKELFYRAYLIDPNDPFTLNNLGYIAELEGQADRAQRYYDLSQAQGSDALVYKSTERSAIGKPVSEVAGNAGDTQMQINRINVQAIGLLHSGESPQADLMLQKALKLDSHNPFTLNNLGYAREKEGELEQAYNFYSQAAGQHSETPIVVTIHKSWRGKPISEIAAANAAKVRNLLDHEQTIPEQVARLNTRAVAAINRNDFRLARRYFQQAYKLDHRNAFALNNMGYLAELDGDRETANYYYDKAREADQSSMRVAYATRKDVEGMKLASVASDSDDAVVKATEEATARLRAEGGPVVLRYRNNQPVMEPATPPKPLPEKPIHAPTQDQLLMPLPENQQPPAAQPGAAPSGAPSQPAASPPNQGNAPANSGGGLLMPLPDNQQPPAARQPAPQSQPQNQNNVPPPPQSQSQPQQTPTPANSNGGLLMPLPESQQPPAAKQPQQ